MTDVPTLDARQQRMVDTYLAMNHGLAVLASVPGAGKSTVIGKAVAADLLARVAAGDGRPHERIIVASFSKEDAADIVPSVVAWIEELYARRDAPDGVDRTDIDQLITQIRTAPRIGTIDSVLRTVFRDVATSMGFDGMPTVGNAALVEKLHRDAYESIITSTDTGHLVERVEQAYQDSADDSSVAGLLRNALEIARQRKLSPQEFRACLHKAVRDNYRGGAPSSFKDVLNSVAAYRDEEIADRLRETLKEQEKRSLLEADQTIYTEWMSLVETFSELFREYATQYDKFSRERGIISHTDCAVLVDKYFRDEQYASPRRKRLRARYRDAIDSIVLDEAQDVSRIQHDALAHLVADDARILLAGDLHQCIYRWRDARPDLFAQAIEDARYFGRTWEPHETEKANQNYRSRPSIVRFANAISKKGLGHDERGGLDEVSPEAPTLHANRNPSSSPSLHVAAFRPSGFPGRKAWVAPDNGGGEARILARYVAGAIADGQLSSESDTPGITVLFPRRRYMQRYATAFEEQGLTVADASAYLFHSTAVRAVIDVIEWFADPTNMNQTRELITDSSLSRSDGPQNDSDTGLQGVADVLESTGWSIQKAADSETLNEPQARVLNGLAGLIDDARSLRVEPASVLVREVIDRLRMEADPLGVDPETDDIQRVATLDAFIELVEEWEGDDRYGPSQLRQLLDPFLQTPRIGPTQPVADPDAVDVVFRTIHDMKGDQDDIVVLADTACSQAYSARRMTTLATSGSGVALAPPADVVDPSMPRLPGVNGNLYTPDPRADRGRPGTGGGHGLRWEAEYWTSEDTGPTELRGAPIRRDAAVASRAESWRMLHVAVTRARDHLVIPLPQDDGSLSSRDHWTQVLCDVFGMNVLNKTGTNLLSLPDGSNIPQDTRVIVNDVALDVNLEGSKTDRVVPTQRPDQPVPPTDIVGDEWNHRFVRPSLVGPLVDDPEEALASVIRYQTINTETERVANDLPLTFETISTETVGDIVHRIVTRLVTAQLSVSELSEPIAHQIAHSVLDNMVNARGDERAGLQQFLVEGVLPGLASSDLWKRVERAQAVYTEEPLHATKRIAGVDIEIQGKADLLVVLPDGTHYIEEIKTALAKPTSAQWRRYHFQIMAYAEALQQQVESDVDVVPQVTTVGAVTETYDNSEGRFTSFWEEFSRLDPD